ncbi:MAG: ABC transporter ATP-binding protein [Patescibacteria group bacterium]|jgi:ABC-type multidrug transport system fused ATPase/permease subunit
MSDWEDQTAGKDRNLHFFVTGMRTLWDLLGQEKGRLTALLGWQVFLSSLTLLFPYLLKLVFDQLPLVLAGTASIGYIVQLIVAMFVIKTCAQFLHHFSKEKRFANSVIYLENWWPVMAQQKLLDLSLGYHEKENTGKKIARINKGCDKLVEILMHLFWGFLPQLFFLVVNLAIVLIIDWRLGLAFALPFIPAAIINIKAFDRFSADWEEWERKKEVSTGFFCQSIINVNTVQSFVQEKEEESRLCEVRQSMEKLDIKVNRRLQKWLFAVGSILHLCFVLTIALGVYLVINKQTSVGTLVYLVATGTVTIDSLWETINVYMRIMRNLVAVRRMKELIDEPVDIVNGAEAKTLDEFVGDVAFEQVNFVYPGKTEPVLDDFNLSIAAGQMVALVGKSGEGKTTIARLVSRMYDPINGQITLDHNDIRDLDLYWYRRLFAVVQQDVDIFDGTLFYNISYPCAGATEEQVLEALSAAHLGVVLKDAKRFPDGLQTQVGERGVRLSGGERQRVGIARAYLALLCGARILILDEATSSLDSEAERAIQTMLDKLRSRQGITVIAIAHRLSTIQRADKICVISGGTITEQGDHQQLMKQNGLYSHLVELQQLGDLRE